MIQKIFVDYSEKVSSLKTKMSTMSLGMKREEEKVREVWREFKPERRECSMVAVDGGMVVKEFRKAVFYAVDAEALYWDGKDRPIYSDGEIDLMTSGSNPRPWVAAIMEKYETIAGKSSIEANSEYILMDGSLISPFMLVRKVSERERRRRSKNAEKEDELDEFEAEERLAEEIQEALADILATKKAFWVSKVSRVRTLFKSDLSDVAVLETLTDGSGYTTPFHVSIPEDYILDQRISTLTSNRIWGFYMRLEDKRKILKVETSWKPTEKEIESFMGCLAKSNVDGYPYPLLKVHLDVKFGRDDQRRLLESLGFSIRPVSSWWPKQLL